MWDAQENLNSDWMTKGSNSFRLSCPVQNGQDKSFQWDIEMKKGKRKKKESSKSGKFGEVRSAHYTVGELTNVGCKCRLIPRNVPWMFELVILVSIVYDG